MSKKKKAAVETHGEQTDLSYVKIPHIGHDVDFREMIEMCDKALTVKGADYTQGDSLKSRQGRLKNFYRNSDRLDLSPYKILAVYMFKHIDAVEAYLRRGFVESEPIEGRIMDCINYFLLLYKMIKHEREHRASLNASVDAMSPR